jgi:hypothetical protein
VKTQSIDVEWDLGDLICAAIRPIWHFGYDHAYTARTWTSRKGFFLVQCRPFLCWDGSEQASKYY